MDSLQTVKINPDKKVIFLAVGFETTSPYSSYNTYLKQQKYKKLFVLTTHKLTHNQLKRCFVMKK